MEIKCDASISPIPGVDPRFSIRRIPLSDYRYHYELLVGDTVVESDSHYHFLRRSAKVNAVSYLATVDNSQEKEGVEDE
jgi:hypothetical protein